MVHDYIAIKGLHFFAHHGVFLEEKTLGQQFILDINLQTDLSKVGTTDNLEFGLCYKSVIENVLNFCTKNRFATIEALAEHVIAHLFDCFAKISAITLTVSKPHAAINAHFDNISITMSRVRVLNHSLKNKSIPELTLADL